MPLSQDILKGDLFHLCGPILEPGAVIIPGNWGRILRRWGWLHSLAIREHALEEARKQIAPELPSRLSCAFVFLTKDEALAFRGAPTPGQPLRGFEAHLLYRVRLIEPEAPHYLTDHALVQPHGSQGFWPNTYWQPLLSSTEESADLHTMHVRAGLTVGRRELLTLSRLSVLERFDDAQ